MRNFFLKLLEFPTSIFYQLKNTFKLNYALKTFKNVFVWNSNSKYSFGRLNLPIVEGISPESQNCSKFKRNGEIVFPRSSVFFFKLQIVKINE